MANVFQEIPIEELCSRVTTGATPLRSRSDFYEGGTTDWYKTGELKDWYLDPAEERITEKALEETSVKLFPANTVLMAMYGDGRTITSLGMLRAPAATNQACSAMLVDEEKCNTRYFFYALKGRRHLLLKVASGGAQRNLSGKLIKEFKLPVPPLPVQRRIAGILSAYDELMENSQRRIRLLEAMARALYREWFVHFRFPGHNTKSSASDNSPDFVSGMLGDLCGLTKDTYDDAVHSELPLLDLAHMPSRTLAPQDTGHPSELTTSRIVFKKNDTLFGAIRCYLHKVVAAHYSGVTNTSVLVLRPKRPCFRSLLAIIASDAETIRWAEAQSTGTKMPVINWGIFQKMPAPVPSAGLAQEFENIAGPMLDQIGIHAIQIQNLRRTRDLLLPRLLSGQVSLAVNGT